MIKKLIWSACRRIYREGIFLMIALKKKANIIRLIVWNRGILLAWYRLWIRKDESHRSLDADYDAMRVMSGNSIMKYLSCLSKRRDVAHRRDLERLRRI